MSTLSKRLDEMRTAASNLAREFSDAHIPSITVYASGVVAICNAEGTVLDYNKEEVPSAS